MFTMFWIKMTLSQMIVLWTTFVQTKDTLSGAMTLTIMTLWIMTLWIITLWIITLWITLWIKA